MIFYYSRSGKTKIFAEALGEFLGQQVYELESDLNKKGGFGFLIKALALTLAGKSSPVSNMPENVAEEIYICAPIWGGQVVGPPKFFLENADLKKTTVNLVLTAQTPTEKYKKNAF
ncbi:MAG: hypothetical protein LBI27_03605, partial [Clostridiales bacterium]|nr:hypothetical protein [Clostridiales bacterium]